MSHIFANIFLLVLVLLYPDLDHPANDITESLYVQSPILNQITATYCEVKFLVLTEFTPLMLKITRKLEQKFLDYTRWKQLWEYHRLSNHDIILSDFSTTFRNISPIKCSSDSCFLMNCKIIFCLHQVTMTENRIKFWINFQGFACLADILPFKDGGLLSECKKYW
jgi:hypothetical protein